jgi:uncharacterized protein involved in outer membrane biogenesis
VADQLAHRPKTVIWKKLALGAGLGTGLVALGLGIAWWALDPEMIRSKTQEWVSLKLDRDVKIQDASLGLWPLAVELDGIEIAAPRDSFFSRTPLLGLDKVELRVDLMALFVGKAQIEKIYVEGLQVHYEVLANGQTNLDGLTAPDTAVKDTTPLDWSKLSAPAALKLEAFEIRDAKISYWNRKEGQKVLLEGLNEKMQISMDSTLTDVRSTGVLTIDEVSVMDQKGGIRKGGIQFALSHGFVANLRQQKLQVDSLHFRINQWALSTQAQIQGFKPDSMQLQLSWDAPNWDLAGLWKTVPAGLSPEIPKITVAGMMSSKGTLALVPGKNPDWSVKSILSQAAVTHADVPAKVENAQWNLDANPQRISLKNLSFVADQQPVAMQLELTNPLAQAYLEKLDLNAKLELARIGQLLEKLALLPAGYQIAGQLAVALQASGVLDPQDPLKLQATGKVNWANLNVRVPQIPEALVSNGALDLSPTALMVKANSTLGSTQVKTDLKIQDYLAFVMPARAGSKVMHVQYTVESPYIAVDKLLSLLPGSSTPQEDAPPATTFPELPKNLKASGQIKAQKIDYQNLSLTGMQIGTRYDAGVIQGDFVTQAYTGKLQANFVADLSNPKDGKISLNSQAKSVEADDFISRLNDWLGESPLHKELKKMDHVVKGKMDFNADLRLQGVPATMAQSLDGTVDLKIYNGVLNEIPQIKTAVNSVNQGVTGFGKNLKIPGVQIPNIGLPVQFKEIKGAVAFEKGNLVIKDWNLDNPALGLFLALGKVGIDTRLDLKMDYVLPPALSKKLLETQSSLVGAAGKLIPSSQFALPAGVNALPMSGDGRVLLPFIIAGTLLSPEVKLDQSKMVNLGNVAAGFLGSQMNAAKALAKAKADSLKNVATQKLNDEKRKAEERIVAEKRKIEERAKQEKQKAENKAKDAVKSKTKDALKGIGF